MFRQFCLNSCFNIKFLFIQQITTLNLPQTSNIKTKTSNNQLDDLELTLNKIQQEFQLLTKIPSKK